MYATAKHFSTTGGKILAFSKLCAIIKVQCTPKREQEAIMAKETKYFIVEASALPEVFLKVAEAKRLLAAGEANTVGEATQMTGISRSAFYKYRDAVLPFQNMMAGRIITFQLLMHDAPGVLSALLLSVAELNCNIITINSIVPTGGTAVVTISAETMNLSVSLDEFLQILRHNKGVIKAEILAG
jgi:chorismate mutase